MPNTIADIIKLEAERFIQVNNNPDLPNLVLTAQAEALIENDADGLQRLGQNFPIPSEEELELHLQIRFNPFLAEPLLREGSLLLDRCLQQQREFLELNAKRFEAFVQIDELFRLNNIALQEETEVYELPAEIEEHNKSAIENESKHNQESLRHIRDELEPLAVRARATAFASGHFIKDDGSLRQGEPIPLFNTDPRLNIAPITVALHAHNYADFSVRFEQNVRIKNLEGNVATESGNSSVIDERLKAVDVSIEYQRKTAEFQKLRNEVARLIALRRFKALTMVDGALNYGEQMRPIKERFDNDLIAAWLRLSAAAKGFNMLYDYPLDIFPRKSADRKINFDDLVTWAQHTNTWLAAFLDEQQQVSRSFSLRQLSEEQNLDFSAGLTSGRWKFRLNEEHFFNRTFVRLRSFAIQIDSGHNSGNWNVAITPPTKGIINKSGNISSRRNTRIDVLDQKHIRTLFLGRINERTFAVIPESASPPRFFNASPIGEDSKYGDWEIHVFNSSTSDTSVSEILDIDIHLTVTLV